MILNVEITSSGSTMSCSGTSVHIWMNLNLYVLLIIATRRTESWLLFACARKVERLELNLLLFNLFPSGGHHPGNLEDNYVFPSPFLDFNNGKAISDGGSSGLLQFDFKYLKSLSLKRLDVTGEVINSLLMKCPFLEQLEVVGTLKLGWLKREETYYTSRNMNRRSSSLKNKSLKVFEYFGYCGHDRDVELIMHVADSAIGLEKIIIDFSGCCRSRSRAKEETARNIALQQFDSLRKSIPTHVHLLIR